MEPKACLRFLVFSIHHGPYRDSRKGYYPFGKSSGATAAQRIASATMSLRFADHFAKSVFFARLDSRDVFSVEKSAFFARLDSHGV